MFSDSSRSDLPAHSISQPTSIPINNNQLSIFLQIHSFLMCNSIHSCCLLWLGPTETACHVATPWQHSLTYSCCRLLLPQAHPRAPQHTDGGARVTVKGICSGNRHQFPPVTVFWKNWPAQAHECLSHRKQSKTHGAGGESMAAFSLGLI